MSQRYPCPNPVCTHEFDAVEVAGVVSVTCPRCGMVIQLRAAPPAAQAAVSPLPSVPMARRVTDMPMVTPFMQIVPMAIPVRAVAPGAITAAPVGIPLAEAVAPAPAQTAASTTPAAPILRARSAPRSRDWITFPLVIGGFLLIVALGFVGIMIHNGGSPGGSLFGGGTAFKSSDFNFSIQKRAGWDQSVDMREKFGVSQLVLRHSDPPGYLAIDAIDFKDRNPAPREQEASALKLLGAFFKKNLEAEAMADAELAGRKAHRVVFRGDTEDGAAVGEVVFLAEQGIGYWLYFWSSDAKALGGEFAELREGFALLGNRSKWEDVQSRQIILTGARAGGYRLVDASGRWEKEKDDELDAYDPAADLALQAMDPTSKIKSQGAIVVVMSLPSSKEPMEAAREHILAKHRREGHPGTKIADVAGQSPRDRVGDNKGYLSHWHISNADGLNRYAVIGVVPRAKDILVIYAEAGWDRHFTWEEPFQKIVESVQVTE